MDDYRDIEHYVVHSGAAPSIGLLRPLYPRWRQQLLANGVERVSSFDALASNLMILFIRDAMVKPERAGTHEHRNLLWRQGAQMLRRRGWKV